MSDFSIDRAQFTDYVGSKGYVSPLSVKLVDGRWFFDLSASGLSMDHDNLKSQLTTPATAKGLPASIQFETLGLPAMSEPSYELVFVFLSGTDRVHDAGEREISVALEATVSSSQTLLTIATNKQRKVIAIDPPISGFNELPVDFPLTVAPLLAIEAGGSGFNGTFELASLFAFVSGSPLLKSALSGDFFSLAGQRFMSIEVRPFGSNKSIFSVDVRLPISLQSNQAPQIVKTPAPILLTDGESTLSLASLFSDATTDTVTYSIKGESDSAFEVIGTSLDLSFWTDDRISPGTQAKFTLRATDQSNAAAETDLQVIRATKNESPVAYAFDSNLKVADTWRYDAQYHRNTTTADADALQLGDVISALKFFLRLQTPTAIQQRAADYDDDGDIDLSDVIGALKGFLHLPGSTPTWEIFDVDASDGVELVGLLNGDVDGSWGTSV